MNLKKRLDYRKKKIIIIIAALLLLIIIGIIIIMTKSRQVDRNIASDNTTTESMDLGNDNDLSTYDNVVENVNESQKTEQELITGDSDSQDMNVNTTEIETAPSIHKSENEASPTPTIRKYI